MVAKHCLYSEAQGRFIKKTRATIDRLGAKFFDSHDWERVESPGGRKAALSSNVTAESFYVKPIAAWVPHLLFENHVPSCPRCGSSRFVDVSKSRWVNTPKLLFGSDSHRYLDTKLYPCGQCNHRFTGYNRQSMEQHAELYVGFFNFYLSARFACDDKLHSLVTSCYDMPTPTIHRILEQNAVDKFLSDQMYYLHAARAKRVKAKPAALVNGQQTTLDPVLTNVTNNQASAAERTLLDLRSQLKRKRLAVLSAEASVQDPVDFKRLYKEKKGRNNRGMFLKAMGVQKLEALLSAGVTSARHLFNMEDIPAEFCDTWTKRKKWNQWKDEIGELFDERVSKLERLQNDLRRLEEQIEQQENTVAIETIVTGIAPVGRDDDRQRRAICNQPTSIPPFSKMKARDGYNATCRPSYLNVSRNIKREEKGKPSRRRVRYVLLQDREAGIY